MRTLYNKIIRNNKAHPYLRVSYKRRGLYCSVDCNILSKSQKLVNSFKEFCI